MFCRVLVCLFGYRNGHQVGCYLEHTIPYADHTIFNTPTSPLKYTAFMAAYIALTWRPLNLGCSYNVQDKYMLPTMSSMNMLLDALGVSAIGTCEDEIIQPIQIGIQNMRLAS